MTKRVLGAALLTLVVAVGACSSGGDEHNTTTVPTGSIDEETVLTAPPDEGITDADLQGALASKLEQFPSAPDCTADSLVIAAANGSFARSELLAWATDGPLDDALRDDIDALVRAAACAG